MLIYLNAVIVTMVVHNSKHEPDSTDQRYYECYDCGTRTTSDEHVAVCPECGGLMKNITVARE